MATNNTSPRLGADASSGQPARGSSAPDRAVRRPARQPRSQATLERILEAAGHTFDEFGVEASTMDAVAVRAGTSIGSVYRFFTDKQALIVTLTERWRERAFQVFASLYSDESLTSDADEVVAEFIMRFERLVEQSPGTRGLLAAAITASDGVPDEAWTGHIERFISHYAPDLPSARLRAAAQTYQIITFALMCATARASSSMSTQRIDARSVLVGYIHQLASEA